MLASHSTQPSVFKPFIEKIGDGVPGATVVNSFAQGAAALKAGKQIRYEGPGVVLDEPTANLAPIIASAVLQQHVCQLAATGASVLVVEQRARAVLEISDRTYVLGGGQLRMEGTPAELGASSEFIDSFLGGTPSRA